MGQIEFPEKMYLAGFAPVQVSGPQPGEVVGGQICHLPVAYRRKVLGHEHSGRLAEEILGAGIQRSQGGQINIQPDLVVKGDEVHTQTF